MTNADLAAQARHLAADAPAGSIARKAAGVLAVSLATTGTLTGARRVLEAVHPPEVRQAAAERVWWDNYQGPCRLDLLECQQAGQFVGAHAAAAGQLGGEVPVEVQILPTGAVQVEAGVGAFPLQERPRPLNHRPPASRDAAGGLPEPSHGLLNHKFLPMPSRDQCLRKVPLSLSVYLR